MTYEDVLALAKAGFSAEHIIKLCDFNDQNSPAPEPAEPAKPAEPAEQAVDPQIKALNDRIDTIMATIADLGKISATKDALNIDKVPSTESGISPAAQHTIDEVLKSINGLEQKVQNGLMQAIEQPNPVTAETVLAKIINPPTSKE